MRMSDEEWRQRIRADDPTAWSEMIQRLRQHDLTAWEELTVLAQRICDKNLASWPEYAQRQHRQDAAYDAVGKCWKVVCAPGFELKKPGSDFYYLSTVIVRYCSDLQREVEKLRSKQAASPEALEAHGKPITDPFTLIGYDPQADAAPPDQEEEQAILLLADVVCAPIDALDRAIYRVCIIQGFPPKEASSHLPLRENGEPYSANTIGVRKHRLERVKLPACRQRLTLYLQVFCPKDVTLLRLRWQSRDWDGIALQLANSLAPSALRQHWLTLIADLTARIRDAK